jgi:hypothetical protein
VIGLQALRFRSDAPKLVALEFDAALQLFLRLPLSRLGYEQLGDGRFQASGRVSLEALALSVTSLRRG